MEIPQELKNGTALWPSNYNSGYLSEEIQNPNSKEYVYPYVYCSVIYNSQNMEATKCPSKDEWIKKTGTYMHNRILLSHKKEWNLTICDRMDGPSGHYAKWNKSDKYHMISLTCVI